MTSSTPLDAKEIRSLMSDLEKAGGSTDKVVSLLTIFDERVQPTEKLLRVCLIILFTFNLFY